MLQIFKTPTKVGGVPRSFCKNLDSVQNQDQDHDFTLDFNIRTTSHT